MVENMNTSDRFDSTTIRHIHLKYRYSTRPKVIIGPLFDPEYWPNSGSFSNSEAGSKYSPKFDMNPYLFNLYHYEKCSITYYTTERIENRLFMNVPKSWLRR